MLNATGYDRTKGSKRDQGIITPKAPQNRPKRRSVFSPKTLYHNSLFNFRLGEIALKAFKKEEKIPVKITPLAAEKKGFLNKIFRRGVR